MEYVLAIDQGTTGSRAFIFDSSGHVRATAYQEFKQYYPKPGWVEHDADEIWSSCARVIRKAVARGRIDPKRITAIGITNQRETTILWDRVTGKPFYHSQFVLIYDEMKGENQGAPRVILDTSAVRGKMSFKTTLYDGWNHRLDFNAPGEKITTSLQKQIMKNTIFKIEDIYNFNPASEDPENIVIGSFGVSF